MQVRWHTTDLLTPRGFQASGPWAPALMCRHAHTPIKIIKIQTKKNKENTIRRLGDGLVSKVRT